MPGGGADPGTWGRTSKYNPEVASKFCAALAERNATVKKVCASDPEMPCERTIFNWIRVYPEFREMYEVARTERCDAMAEEILDLADETELDKDSVRRATLQIDVRKWLLSNYSPRRYGSKVALTDSEGGPVRFRFARTPDEVKEE